MLKRSFYKGKKRLSLLPLMLTVLLCLAFIAGTVYLDRFLSVQSGAEGFMRIYVLDCGDAFGAIIEKDGRYCMIDTGSYAERWHLYDMVKALGIKKIDLIVLSHSHSDHFGGYPALRGVEIGTVYISPFTDPENDFYQDCLEFFRGSASLVVTAPVGETVESDGMNFTFLGPLKTYEDVNDCSVVVRLSFGSTSFMFPGDMTGTEADDIMDSGAVMLSDVLMASHHGSAADGANSYRLLREVMPGCVVISTAGSSSTHGYPHEALLGRLSDLGCTVHRTDLEGDLIIESDGSTVSVRGMGDIVK